jgi:hypothetical protein
VFVDTFFWDLNPDGSGDDFMGFSAEPVEHEAGLGEVCGFAKNFPGAEDDGIGSEDGALGVAVADGFGFEVGVGFG